MTLHKHAPTRRPSPVRPMLFAVAALVALAFPAGPARADDWVRYTAPDHSFALSVPVTPEVDSDNGALRIVASPSEKESYIIEVTDLNGPREYMADKLFLATVSAFVNTSKATIESQNRHDVLGHPADDFKLKTKEGYHVWERTMVINDHFYQLMHITAADDDQPTRFWDSFVIRP